MNFGILEEKNIVKCANCKKIISTNGEIICEFCPNCGSPLTLVAIETKEAENYSLKRNVALTISEIAKENKTESVTVAVKKYLEDIK